MLEIFRLTNFGYIIIVKEPWQVSHQKACSKSNTYKPFIEKENTEGITIDKNNETYAVVNDTQEQINAAMRELAGMIEILDSQSVV